MDNIRIITINKINILLYTNTKYQTNVHYEVVHFIQAHYPDTILKPGLGFAIELTTPTGNGNLSDKQKFV